MNLILKVGLSTTIANIGPFYLKLVRKFIVNLSSDFNDPSSLDFQHVHIRGSQFRISLAIINSFLGNNVSSYYVASFLSNDELASVLSSGTLSIWPINDIPAISLSTKYAILYKIGIVN